MNLIRPTVAPPPGIDEPWKVVAGHLKGGVGKSTLVWLLCYEIARRAPGKVLAVDADPLSQTLADSYRAAMALGIDVPFEIQEWRTSEGFVEGVTAVMRKKGCTHLVVDVGGESEDILAAACMVAEELIIPNPPNRPDTRRLHATLSVAARAGSLRAQKGESLSANILQTRVSTNPKVQTAKERREWMQAPERDWPVLLTEIPSKVFYESALEDFPEESSGRVEQVLRELAFLRAGVDYEMVDGVIVAAEEVAG